MTAYSKAALKARIESFFPDNTTRYITPERLREICEDIVDSYDDVGSEITGGPGTAGKIVKWLSTTEIADSILTELGALITVAGSLAVTGLTASRVVTTDSLKQLISSAVTATEMGYLSGVTSNVQTQLNAKKVTQVFADDAARAAATPDFIGQFAFQLDTGGIWISGGLTPGYWNGGVTLAEFVNLIGTTTYIQNQIDEKVGTYILADDAARAAEAPEYVGQYAFQVDTGAIYVGDGLSAGDWAGGVTLTLLGYLTGLSGNVQNQINALKVTRVFADSSARTAATPDFVGQYAVQVDTMAIYVSNGLSAGNWGGGITITEFAYLSGVTSNIQAQLNSKGSVLNVNVTPVGNVGGGTDNLQQYTVPAGTLSQDGDFLEIDISGTLRTDGAVTSINFLFGGMGLFSTGGGAIAIPNTGGTSSIFRIKTKIVRLGAAAQFAFTTISFASGAGAVVLQEMQTVGTETLSGSLVLKMQATATNDNDVVQAVTIVKYNS